MNDPLHELVAQAEEAHRQERERLKIGGRMLKHARRSMQFPLDVTLLGLGEKTMKRVHRIAEKLTDDVRTTPAQVIDAALSALEWKIDREAEGLRIQAGEPLDEEPEDDVDDEPWPP